MKPSNEHDLHLDRVWGSNFAGENTQAALPTFYGKCRASQKLADSNRTSRVLIVCYSTLLVTVGL